MAGATPIDDALTAFLVDLLERWAAGDVTPAEVMRVAGERWATRTWPDLDEHDPANAQVTVLDWLAHGRTYGIMAEDAPVLLATLHARGDPWQQLGEHLLTTDLDARDAVLAAGSYGPGTEVDEPQWELGMRDPEHRRLHRGVREDPESVWLDVRARMCGDEVADPVFIDDLLDDLLFFHADAFVDRVLEAARDCRPAMHAVVWVHIGGVAGASLDRFEVERRRMEDALVAAGDLTVWRAGDPELDAASELLARQTDDEAPHSIG